jgi:hypothetical protein
LKDIQKNHAKQTAHLRPEDSSTGGLDVESATDVVTEKLASIYNTMSENLNAVSENLNMVSQSVYKELQNDLASVTEKVQEFTQPHGTASKAFIRRPPPRTPTDAIGIIKQSAYDLKPQAQGKVQAYAQVDKQTEQSNKMNSKELEKLAALNPRTETGTYSKPICQAKWGAKTYLPQQKSRLPPMLYTFPGSGNTWGRLLIEHATGIYTGSVYNDRTLLSALPGELTCNWRVSVIKVHPHTHSFADLYSGRFHSDGNQKCKRGGVKRFERAVLLIRNPFDSIWSEYQRRITQSHVQGESNHDFVIYFMYCMYLYIYICKFRHNYRLGLYRRYLSVPVDIMFTLCSLCLCLCLPVCMYVYLSSHFCMSMFLRHRTKDFRLESLAGECHQPKHAVL